MADKQIMQLPAATQLNATDRLPIQEQGTATKNVTAQQIANFVLLQVTPLGKLQIHDPQGQFFSDLVSARAYVQLYTNADITNELYYDGTYYLDVPIGSDFSLNDNFLTEFSGQLIDPRGCIGVVGNDFLVNSSGDNVIGNVIAGDNFLRNSQGNNVMGDVTAGDRLLMSAQGNNVIKMLEICGIEFALNYIGTVTIQKFGIDGTQNLPNDILTSVNLVVLKTEWQNQFNNSGTMDADLVNAIANMTNPNSTVMYI